MTNFIYQDGMFICTKAYTPKAGETLDIDVFYDKNREDKQAGRDYMKLDGTWHTSVDDNFDDMMGR